ncbi:MAG TPA: hypothetical protein VN616_10480 [Puia sp.]|nr:hypothetical protein [Puia sp.]
MKRIIVLFLLSSCTNNSDMQQVINSKDVKEIEIRNGTTNNYIPKKITVTDRFDIGWLVREVNTMTLLNHEVSAGSIEAAASGFWAFLKPDIHLFGSGLPDKIKEALYLEIGALCIAGLDIGAALQLV